MVDLICLGYLPDGRHKGDVKHDPLMLAMVDSMSMVWRRVKVVFAAWVVVTYCSHNLHMGEYPHMVDMVECDYSIGSGRCHEGAGRKVFVKLLMLAHCSHNGYACGGDYYHMISVLECDYSALAGRMHEGAGRHLDDVRGALPHW